MPRARLATLATRAATPWAWPRLAGLVRFHARRQGEQLGMRMSKLYAIGLLVTYAVLAILTFRGGNESALRALVVRELFAASWIVAGLAGLSLAGALAERDRAEGIPGLLALRGVSNDEVALARLLAGARRIALAIGLPALATCAVAALGTRSLRGALALAALAVAVCLYAVILGLAVSALARAASALAPRWGRSLFAALVLLPHAAREIWPWFPSVPAGFGALLRLVASAGGAGA